MIDFFQSDGIVLVLKKYFLEKIVENL